MYEETGKTASAYTLSRTLPLSFGGQPTRPIYRHIATAADLTAAAWRHS